jgi:hypothetical protein
VLKAFGSVPDKESQELGSREQAEKELSDSSLTLLE